jgi:hypothetical protein
MDASSCLKALDNRLDGPISVADGLNQYKRYIVQIEINRKSEPNIAFEAIKALGDALFKHILKHRSIKGEYKDILTHADVSTVRLFKNTCLALADHDLLDIEIMKPGQQFFHNISEIRNSIGLISHGKDLREIANLQQSTIELAIANLINHVLVILEAYEQLLDGPPLRYEDNADFNEYLDDENEIEGISYSQALYDQDLIAYIEHLDEYNEFKNEEL